jgi:hypothetical protein
MSLKPILVCIRVNLAGRDTDADVLGFSRNLELGGGFLEVVAARDIYAKFWDHRKFGSPCFDPFTDEGDLKPLPPGKFIMWDEIEQHPDIPSTTRASITAYDAAEPDTDPNDLGKRKAIRRFKLSLAQPTINDLMAVNTEGDRLLEETIRKHKYVASGLDEAVASSRAKTEADSIVKIEDEEEEDDQ